MGRDEGFGWEQPNKGVWEVEGQNVSTCWVSYVSDPNNPLLHDHRPRIWLNSITSDTWMRVITECTFWLWNQKGYIKNLDLYFVAYYFHFVPCCCCLLWKGLKIWLYLPRALMDFNQKWVIDATWEPLFVDEVKGHIKATGHLRSSCKIGWKYENGLIQKV